MVAVGAAPCVSTVIKVSRPGSVYRLVPIAMDEGTTTVDLVGHTALSPMVAILLMKSMFASP